MEAPHTTPSIQHPTSESRGIAPAVHPEPQNAIIHDRRQAPETDVGFKKREGNKHTVYSHPDFPQLRATVARHRSLPKGYVTTALKLIARLEQLEKGAHEEIR